MEASSADVERDFSTYREAAAGIGRPPEPVTVLHDDKPSVVIVSAAEYARLTRRDQPALPTENLPQWIVNQIEAGEMDTALLTSTITAEISLPGLTSGLMPELTPNLRPPD